jgi:hypothetical protein
MPNAAFTSLVDDVYIATNRPDLVSETSMAVRAATHKLHQSDFYPRDLAESRVVFETADYFQSLAYRTLFPNFRALSYMRKYEGGAPTQLLEVISPTDIFDGYKLARENVCYLAGEAIQIRSNTSFAEILVGYYLNPTTHPDTYSSWIADVHRDAITSEASAAVFRMIGAYEQAQMYDRMAREQLLLVRNNNIQVQGY